MRIANFRAAQSEDTNLVISLTSTEVEHLLSKAGPTAEERFRVYQASEGAYRIIWDDKGVKAQKTKSEMWRLTVFNSNSRIEIYTIFPSHLVEVHYTTTSSDFPVLEFIIPTKEKAEELLAVRIDRDLSRQLQNRSNVLRHAFTEGEDVTIQLLRDKIHEVEKFATLLGVKFTYNLQV